MKTCSAICYLLLLSALAAVSGMDSVKYQGLRLDMSALTLNRDIISTIVPAINMTQHAEFGIYEQEGAFWTKCQVSDVHIVYSKINEDRFDMNSFDYAYPVYRLKGGYESIFFNIEFRYALTFLGITLESGVGEAAVTNVRNEILVFWNSSDPDVQLPHPWDIKNMTFSSVLPLSELVTSILHNEFISHFHQAVDASMDDFAHDLLKPYRYIEDVFPDEVDLVFRNDILSVQPTVNNTYFSIAFKTNITVNGYVHKKIYRKISGEVAPKGDFDYCMPSEMVPDVYDALGKGAYRDKLISHEAWNFSTDKIREFFEILPGLKDRYTGEEAFIIDCQSERYRTVNDVTQREWEDPLLEMQDPLYCSVQVAGEYVIMVDVFLRMFYEMKCKDEAFYASVHGCTVIDFRTTPLLPYSRLEILEKHVSQFALYFHDKDLMTPGIKVKPNRAHEMTFFWVYTHPEEICFYYNEVRPVSPRNA